MSTVERAHRARLVTGTAATLAALAIGALALGLRLISNRTA
jgi:hypothetical protein